MKKNELDFLDEKDGAGEIDETDEYCLATHSFFNVLTYLGGKDACPDDQPQGKRCCLNGKENEGGFIIDFYIFLL